MQKAPGSVFRVDTEIFPTSVIDNSTTYPIAPALGAVERRLAWPVDCSTLHQARLQVSKLLGHERDEVTKIYLAGIAAISDTPKSRPQRQTDTIPDIKPAPFIIRCTKDLNGGSAY